VQYRRVDREDQLLELLADPGAIILCGGTDLMIRLRTRKAHPNCVIDISSLRSLQGIDLQDDWIEIGAATPIAEILDSPSVQAHAPLLVTALQRLGSVQIRNRGTLGGNLVNASPAADSAIPLLLYDAQLKIVGRAGARWLPLDQFFLGPGKTVLAPGEYVKAVRMARTEGACEAFYHKVGRRNAMIISIASLGILAWRDGSRLSRLRAAVGSVAPTPLRLRAVETALTGVQLTPRVIQRAQTAAKASILPISDVRAPAEYRTQVIGDLMGRALSSWADL
jgi:CO/xanthine dehydrogenase FAD-binding subunit